MAVWLNGIARRCKKINSYELTTKKSVKIKLSRHLDQNAFLFKNSLTSAFFRGKGTVS